MTHSEDDDKTVIKSGAGLAAAKSGFAPNEECALPNGTRIAEFEIIGLIGVGGFGIVYLAHDLSLGRNVALKEYMPSALADRKHDLSVGVRSVRDADTFAAGLSSFVNEGRLLARFDHPSLVKVYRFWEANGTAYMVMPFYEGLTLKQALIRMSEPPSEEWLMGLLNPLMNAIEVLHFENCFHRDISPDNILLLEGGRPVLLDFGAARRVIGDMAQNLTVILKHGFAPVEQYAEMPGLRQGAWTDIYALAAVVHFAIRGEAPPPSVARVASDIAAPLEVVLKGRYSERFLRCMDRALTLKPEQRPQSIAELRSLLGVGDAPLGQAQMSAQNTAKAVSGVAAHSMSWTKIAGLALATLMASAAAFFLLTRDVTPVAPTQASQPKPGQLVTTPATSSKQSAPPVALGPASPAVSLAQPFSPLGALNQLFDHREQDQVITVDLDKSLVRIGKDKLRFRVHSPKSGYIYVLMVGTENEHINLLFPNALDGANKLGAGKAISLPGAGWAMTAAGPPGMDQFVVMVSENPRDFADVGLIKVGPFAEFPLVGVARLMETSPSQAALAGKPICASKGHCSTAYGAARFSIEEVN